jgi:hypothetical protein
VIYSPGAGFEVGVEYGRTARSAELGKALSSVIEPNLLMGRGLDAQETEGFFIGVGSKPPKKPDR